MLTLVSMVSFGQKRKFRPLIWTQHDKNVDVVGLSLGAFPTNSRNSDHLNKTFGIRLEAFPLSPLYFLAPKVPTVDSVHHKIYGINISTGTFEGIDVYGLSTTIFMNNIKKANGISLAGLTNSIAQANGIVVGFGGNGIEKGRGIMIGGPWGNYAKDFSGLQVSFENTIVEKGAGIQIGIFNTAKNFKGLQLGLWNKNQARSLPLINWN